MATIFNLLNVQLSPAEIRAVPPASISLSLEVQQSRHITAVSQTYSGIPAIGQWERALGLDRRQFYLGGTGNYTPGIVRAEGDTTVYFVEQLLGLIRAAFQPLGDRFNFHAQFPSPRGTLISDFVSYPGDSEANVVIALVELKRPGYVIRNRWTGDNLGGDTHTDKLTRKIRK